MTTINRSQPRQSESVGADWFRRVPRGQEATRCRPDNSRNRIKKTRDSANNFPITRGIEQKHCESASYFTFISYICSEQEKEESHVHR